jgi:hypothetical protein
MFLRTEALDYAPDMTTSSVGSEEEAQDSAEDDQQEEDQPLEDGDGGQNAEEGDEESNDEDDEGGFSHKKWVQEASKVVVQPHERRASLKKGTKHGHHQGRHGHREEEEGDIEYPDGGEEDEEGENWRERWEGGKESQRHHRSTRSEAARGHKRYSDGNRHSNGVDDGDREEEGEEEEEASGMRRSGKRKEPRELLDLTRAKPGHSHSKSKGETEDARREGTAGRRWSIAQWLQGEDKHKRVHPLSSEREGEGTVEMRGSKGRSVVAARGDRTAPPDEDRRPKQPERRHIKTRSDKEEADDPRSSYRSSQRRHRSTGEMGDRRVEGRRGQAERQAGQRDTREERSLGDPSDVPRIQPVSRSRRASADPSPRDLHDPERSGPRGAAEGRRRRASAEHRGHGHGDGRSEGRRPQNEAFGHSGRARALSAERGMADEGDREPDMPPLLIIPKVSIPKSRRRSHGDQADRGGKTAHSSGESGIEVSYL